MLRCPLLRSANMTKTFEIEIPGELLTPGPHVMVRSASEPKLGAKQQQQHT